MRSVRYLPLAALAVGAAGCAINPATGQRQLMLVSESQEIQMGRESDPAIIAQYGLYPDESLQAYVSGIGQRLAARSERPELPWTFRLVDDATVNAFALPGGFIYVTRGILAYMSSEAELASVMGHEIGHVTARHSAQQMSQQQLAQVGLIAGAVFLPEDWSNLALGVGSAGLQLLFLKFSRDDESQADDLGMRYMVRADYDAREMPGVYEMLDRVSSAGGGGRMPQWLSTHPDPLNREQRMIQHLDTLRNNGTVVNHDGYLRRLDGLVYGVNPREGFFRENVFLHPDLRFRLDFPAGWKTANYKGGVVAASPNNDARMQLTLAEGNSADAAARTFALQEGIQAGTPRATTIHGLRAASLEFSAATEQATLPGLATFIEYGGNVYQLIGYATPDAWQNYRSAIAASHGSFAQLTDQAALRVQPLKLATVQLDGAMTLQRFNQRYPSQVPIDELARLNGVEATATLPRGTLVKRVVGGPLP